MTEAPAMFHEVTAIDAAGRRATAAVLGSAALSTSGLRDAIVTRSMLHLHAATEAGDAPEGDGSSAVDDRLRRRERLLHQLALERQRQRRRRTA